MVNHVAHRIKDIRKVKKMSGTEVAAKLEISSPYYYDIEKGKRNLSSEIAGKLADLFDVSVDYLLGREKSEDNIDNEIEFINKLELNDKELLEQFNLMLDGVPLTEEESKGLIAYLRASREVNKN